jgi:putative N6-adenine-specific DNA methylase
MNIVVKTLSGLEEVLANEIRQITGKPTKLLKSAISFEGDLKDVYRVNYECRTALRVLVEIARTQIEPNEKALYDFVYSIDWNNYITPDNTFAIDSVVYSDYFTHANYVTLKAKDALVDRIKEHKGQGPSVDSQEPDFRIQVHVNKLHEISISMDSSGESLHKRGYREEQYIAPINQVLASGIIQMSKWDKKSSLYDPMCGSGTFSAEALMLAAKIPPRHLKPKFSFQNWQDFDQTLWLDIKQKADSKITIPECEIFAHDISYKAVEVSKFNLKNLSFGGLVNVEQRDFLDRGAVKNAKMIYLNPPYDKRITFEKLNEFYREMGDKLKLDYIGCEAWLITANYQAMKFLGLWPTKKFPLFNGALDCYLYQLNMYEGSKKAKFQGNERRNNNN